MPQTAQNALARRLVVAGVVGIFGGEALCLFGPMKFEPMMDVACHVVLYAGIVCVAVGTAAHIFTSPSSS